MGCGRIALAQLGVQDVKRHQAKVLLLKRFAFWVRRQTGVDNYQYQA